MSAPAPLAISLGDPAGIGPELIAEAWQRRDSSQLPAFFAVGPAQLLREAAAARGLDIEVRSIASPAEAAETFTSALPVLGSENCAFRPGKPDDQGASLALASLTRATNFAIDGTASGIVTGPVAKTQLARIGFTQPGQTEFVADACGVAREDAVMMLAGPSLRTVPLTIHCALAEVPGQLSAELIVRRARIVAQALACDFALERARLAICGLNPHAGEDGRFGDEETRIIIPAIEMLRSEGLDVTGPHPADALFAPHERARYDAALCMYHDQALIPIKALDFDQGVNVTLGLPIVRTSPDHGTAFSIAGKNQADPGAMIAAIRMAGECAARRARL
ncbi:MAG: 4-hydroxythreonine-4-phosphate dehydrogenase PdxA [Sphingomonadaceae bacterium]|nr:4-hydroxythreonine-4-phosphate dehydrogenase PdxA [Sphingomonadaceae bacterium]